MGNITPLCKIAYKYGTDKCPQINHSYTPFYYHLLKHRRTTVKKVLELGVGCNKSTTFMRRRKNVDTIIGASLYMWRDYFPNATIYGADKEPESLISDDRIKTFYCNERNEEDLKNLIRQTGCDIDLFIDDGSHHRRDQLYTCTVLMPLLDKNVTYVIEDVIHPSLIIRKLPHYDVIVSSLSAEYNTAPVSDNLLIVRHKI